MPMVFVGSSNHKAEKEVERESDRRRTTRFFNPKNREWGRERERKREENDAKEREKARKIQSSI